MIDWYKEIVFRDGITLENGVEELTEDFLKNVGHICDLGRKTFGLSLEVFEISGDLVYFEWRGSKANVYNFYNYYSENMTSESIENRNETLLVIINK